MSSLVGMSAVETARRIAAREISSRAVVAGCLARIADVNPDLNAVVALRADAALAGFDPAGLGPMSARDVQRSLFEWDRFRRRMLPFIREYPLIVSPAAEKPAVRHGEDPGGIPYTLIWSLLGSPAVVVRAGTTPEGLPVGVQIAAAPWREDLALAAASIVESASGDRLSTGRLRAA